MVERTVKNRISRGKGAIYPYQAYALYMIAHQFRDMGDTCRVLEIGTARGYSCGFIASALPQARITSLNPHPVEVKHARRGLEPWGNVEVGKMKSWDYLDKTDGVFKERLTWDFIFVDGDHRRIRRDLPYWWRLNPGGIMLFHDYSPRTSTRPCQVVVDGLREWGAIIGPDRAFPGTFLEFDIMVIDDDQVGMVGWIK